jgi:hypothetical protein
MDMRTVPATITYKAKVRHMHTDSGLQDYIDFKASVSRRDCNLRPHQHDYYNSDIFPSMLNRAHMAATRTSEFKRWQLLSELPECVSVDTKGFLATITIQVNV